jgi:hypothetical protein
MKKAIRVLLALVVAGTLVGGFAGAAAADSAQTGSFSIADTMDSQYVTSGFAASGSSGAAMGDYYAGSSSGSYAFSASGGGGSIADSGGFASAYAG